MRSCRQATETSLILLLDCLSHSGVEHEVSPRVISPCNSVAIIEAGAELCCLPAVANKSCSFSESERGEWATLWRRVFRDAFSALRCSSSVCWSCAQHTTSSTLQAPSSYITVRCSTYSEHTEWSPMNNEDFGAQSFPVSACCCVNLQHIWPTSTTVKCTRCNWRI